MLALCSRCAGHTVLTCRHTTPQCRHCVLFCRSRLPERPRPAPMTKEHLDIIKSLPASFDWTNVDGVNYVSAVRWVSRAPRQAALVCCPAVWWTPKRAYCLQHPDLVSRSVIMRHRASSLCLTHGVPVCLTASPLVSHVVSASHVASASPGTRPTAARVTRSAPWRRWKLRSESSPTTPSSPCSRPR